MAEAQAIASPALRSTRVFPSETAKPIDAYNFYRRYYLKAVKDAQLNGLTGTPCAILCQPAGHEWSQ